MSLVAGDFNEDGKLDLATCAASLLLGNGAGSFTAGPDFPPGIYPRVVATGGLDGDGHLDLAIAKDGTDGVTVLLGDGQGGFAARPMAVVGKYPFALVIADLNGDAIPDLLVSTTFNGGIGSNRVHLLLGLGGGRFGPEVPVFRIVDFPASDTLRSVLMTKSLGLAISAHIRWNF